MHPRGGYYYVALLRSWRLVGLIGLVWSCNISAVQPHRRQIFHNVHSSTTHQGDPPTTAGTAPGVLFGPYLV
eukprot:COSAG01_NODE_7546_length_3157_cov_3.524853_1_plen_72_part_00